MPSAPPAVTVAHLSRTKPASPPGLAHGASWQAAAIVVRVLVGLVSVPLYTRLLGMPQWGLLALFQAAVAPLVLLDGMGNATVKYVAEALGRGDERQAIGVVRGALLVNLVAGLLGAVALALLAPWLATSLFAVAQQDREIATLGFRLIGLSWLVGLVSVSWSAVLVATQRFGDVARLGALSVGLSTLAGVAAAALGGGVVAVLVAQSCVAVLMAALQCRSAERALPGVAAWPSLDMALVGRSLSFGSWQAAGTAGVLLSGWGDRYVLGVYHAPIIVGFYAVGSLLAGQLQAAFAEAGEVLFPAVSRFQGRGELAQARRLSLLAGWTLSSAFGVCAAVLAIVGGDFISLWVSPEAAQAVLPALRLLCAAGIIGMVAVAPANYLLGIGRVRWDAISSVGSGLVVVGTGLLLVPRLGLIGVGYGLCLAALLRWLLVFLVWRVDFRTEHRGTSYAAHLVAPALVALGLLAAGCAVRDSMQLAPSWPLLLVEAVLATALLGAIQLGAGELLSGGAQRRRDVVASFKPVVLRVLGRSGA